MPYLPKLSRREIHPPNKGPGGILEWVTFPLLTLVEHTQLVRARDAGATHVDASLDLGRSLHSIEVHATGWSCDAATYPYLEGCKARTVYYWNGAEFRPAARFASSLIKLVPTEWGAPTFEIDGIKMLPTSIVSPYEDAKNKVALIQPCGKVILDTCAGLGYFAAWCIAEGASQIWSYEKNPDVIWLRDLNPWSPTASSVLRLEQNDITVAIPGLAGASCDAVLHDPPRFGIAGELYSQEFYHQLFRVLKPRGRLFHYTGSPNRLGSGRDVPREVMKRLENAGFTAERVGDGILAMKQPHRSRR